MRSVTHLVLGRTTESAFVAVGSIIVGCAGWFVLSTFLGQGLGALASFSVLLVSVTFATSFLFPIDRAHPLLAMATVTITLLTQELLLSSEHLLYGFLIALAATILFPLLGGLMQKDKPLGYVLQATGLLFASRLAYVPFPAKFLNISIGLPSLYLVIFMMCIVFLFVKKVDVKTLGFQIGKMPLATQLFAGLSIGTLSGIAEYFILKPPAIPSIGDPLRNAAYVLFLMMVLVSFSEEILFRGLILGPSIQILPPWVAIQVTSIQFGLMHLGWRNPAEVLFAYGMGMIMGFMFWKTQSLIAPILLHGVGNVAMFFLASLPSIETHLLYLFTGITAASALAAVYLLKRHMPLDAWSSSIEIRRRLTRIKKRLEETK